MGTKQRYIYIYIVQSCWINDGLTCVKVNNYDSAINNIDFLSHMTCEDMTIFACRYFGSNHSVSHMRDPTWWFHIRSSRPFSVPPSPEVPLRNHLLETTYWNVIFRYEASYCIMLDLSNYAHRDGQVYDVVVLGIHFCLGGSCFFFSKALVWIELSSLLIEEVKLARSISHVAFPSLPFSRKNHEVPRDDHQSQ